MTSLSWRLVLLLGLAEVLVPGRVHHAHAAPRDERNEINWDELHDSVEPLGPNDFRVIPLQHAAAIAKQRFRGRLIAARLRPPTPDEHSRGVELVHELRLLTPGRDVLLIRLDARTGAFLEVRGAGLAEARRIPGDRNEGDQ